MNKFECKKHKNRSKKGEMISKSIESRRWGIVKQGALLKPQHIQIHYGIALKKLIIVDVPHKPDQQTVHKSPKLCHQSVY